QEPQLLLVDEPVAGMTDAETEQTADLLREINRTRTVVVVEHDMAFVRALDVKVTVLHEGSVLAEGSLDHASAEPGGVEAIWGGEDAGKGQRLASIRRRRGAEERVAGGLAGAHHLSARAQRGREDQP